MASTSTASFHRPFRPGDFRKLNCPSMVDCAKKRFLGGTRMELTEEVKALLLNTDPGYLDYPFQNKHFGHGSLAHFSCLQRLIFSKDLVF